MRLFIAFDPEAAIKKRIAEEAQKLSAIDSGIKWVEEKNLHITLKFLGWVEDKDLDKVIRIAEEAAGGGKSFKVSFKGMGRFPHVIWIGTKEGEKELKDIAVRLEKGFSSAGFRSEEREFAAHLTIGRIKDRKGVDKVTTQMEKLKEFDFGEMEARSIVIMKSTLTPKGPIYEKIKEVSL